VVFATLLLTTFPSHLWRICDGRLSEPLTGILFLVAFTCTVVMSRAKSRNAAALAVAAFLLYAAHLNLQWLLAPLLLSPPLLLQVTAADAGWRASARLRAAVAAIRLKAAHLVQKRRPSRLPFAGSAV